MGYSAKDPTSDREKGRISVVVAGMGPDYYHALVESMKNPISVKHHMLIKELRRELKEKEEAAAMKQSEQGAVEHDSKNDDGGPGHEGTRDGNGEASEEHPVPEAERGV